MEMTGDGRITRSSWCHHSITKFNIHTCAMCIGIISDNICILFGVRLTYSVNINAATHSHHHHVATNTAGHNDPDTEPSTVLEAKLQEALCTSNAIVEAQKKIMGGMQAQTILQSIYLEGVWGQL
jgi:hypothetical protein